MATSNLSLPLINRALTHLGKPVIADINEPNEHARTMLRNYGTVLRAELRAHAWSFALARVKLPALASVPAFDYGKEYELPVDFLRLVVIAQLWVDTTLRDVGDAVLPAYAIEGRKLLTNLGAPLPIRYIRDVSDAPHIFDALFVEAAAAALALATAPTLVRSEGRSDRIEKAYGKAVATAKRVNAIELPPREKMDASWITSRVW